MEHLAEQALEDVRSAMEAVEEARGDFGLTSIERFELERASLQLRRMERTIIRKTQQDLVNTLGEDALRLEEVAVQICRSAEKLKKVSEAIQKAGKGVEILVKAVAAGLSAGLL
jgi:hypothetical protein